MGRNERKLGMRASHTAEVVLEGCRVLLHNRLETRRRDYAARALKLSREHGYGGIEGRAAALPGVQSAAQT